MREIRNEHQIELAKSILESNGYKVTMKESAKRARKSVFHDMYQDYIEKGKSILGSGKTFEKVIQDAESYLRELQYQIEELKKELKSVARDMEKSGSDDHNTAEYKIVSVSNIDQIERAMTAYYEENVVPVLAAKELLKINRSPIYGHIIRKSKDPQYSLNSLSGGKQNWWNYK